MPWVMMLWVNSFWCSDVICWYRYGSTLAQVMVCCLTAPSLYLTNVHLSSQIFCGIPLRAISHLISNMNYTFKITTTFSWVNELMWHNDIILTLCISTGLPCNSPMLLFAVSILSVDDLALSVVMASAGAMVRGLTHKRHPISHPHGQSMGCLLWDKNYHWIMRIHCIK